jgi:Uroporphyrinogen-III decarboxylase
MTTETTQPQPEMGPASDNGQASQASTQAHRRRRRRRKNRSNQQNPQQGQQPQVQAQQTQPAPAQPQAQAPQPPPQQKQGRQHQNQPRKKKKFFQKGSSQQSQPGNNAGGSQHGKRKGKQRGPREFVGPMDHSYRVANGNVADGPPSTIQMSNHGAGYPDVYSMPPAQVREDAPTRIFCFIEDLFFQAKISETARKLGIKVEFIKGDKDSVARILDAPENEKPTLLVFDLNNANAKPMVLIPKLRSKLKKATSIIGFLNHLQGDLKVKAMEAGCDTVMPRSAFSQSLPNLLRRYGVEEEEEYAQQPM